jgi:demethylmenaquinone methyltransferase/2-methoxy-6-polyprenyl-1,4-benzoquinol methylase
MNRGQDLYPKSPPQVRVMFDALAPRYDLLNHLFALGLDVTWRARAVRALAPAVAGPILDGATGSADIAIALARRYPDRRVVGVDFSEKMVAAGRAKVRTRGLSERVTLDVGDLIALPYDAATFAGATIAFGVRNVADRPRALAEMVRVLRPGGRLMVLELSLPTLPVFAPVYRWYFRNVMPAAAALFGQAETFHYLFESVRAFPSADRFAAMMESAGLTGVRFAPLTFGTAHVFLGTKP